MHGTWSSTSVYGNYQWQWSLYGLYTAIDEATDSSLAILYLEDFLSISNLVQAQLLSHLRTYLSRLSVSRSRIQVLQLEF